MDNKDDTKIYFFHGQKYNCSFDLAMDLIGGKWTGKILFRLRNGAMRSSELQRSLLGISNKMFTQTVRELEKNNIINRTVYPVVPPKVEYKLTEVGQSVLPIILELADWGYKIGKGK